MVIDLFYRTTRLVNTFVVASPPQQNYCLVANTCSVLYRVIYVLNTIRDVKVQEPSAIPSSTSFLTVASSSRTLSVNFSWILVRLLLLLHASAAVADAFLPRRLAFLLSCFSYCAYALSWAVRLFLASFSRSDIGILSTLASSLTSSAWLAISLVTTAHTSRVRLTWCQLLQLQMHSTQYNENFQIDLINFTRDVTRSRTCSDFNMHIR